MGFSRLETIIVIQSYKDYEYDNYYSSKVDCLDNEKY